MISGLAYCILYWRNVLFQYHVSELFELGSNWSNAQTRISWAVFRVRHRWHRSRIQRGLHWIRLWGQGRREICDKTCVTLSDEERGRHTDTAPPTLPALYIRFPTGVYVLQMASHAQKPATAILQDVEQLRGCIMLTISQLSPSSRTFRSRFNSGRRLLSPCRIPLEP
jgi:hypothetical protein